MNRRPEERGRDSVLHRLSGQPGVAPADRLQHHGARILLLVGLAALVTFLFPPVESMQVTPYEEGMVAPEDVIAQIPFSVPRSGGERERERREAAEAVPPTFDERVAAGDSVAVRLQRFFDRIDTAVVSGDTLGVGRILEESRVTAQPSQVEYILDYDRRSALRTAAQTAAREIIPRGMLDPAELAAIPTEIIYVRSPDVPERSRAVEHLILSLIHISEPTRQPATSRMPSSA